MRLLLHATAAAAAMLALGGCAGDDDRASTAGLPAGHKQHRLTKDEYRTMSPFIASDADSSETIQPLCEALRGGPDTSIVAASITYCERAVGVVRHQEELDIDIACARGNRTCAVTYLRENNVAARAADVLVDYRRDIVKVMAAGRCRDLLASRADIKRLRRRAKRYKAAVHQFAVGDDTAVDRYERRESSRSQGRTDPRPCRPLKSGA